MAPRDQTEQADKAARGRLAPSPTGPLHLGNAAALLLAWLSLRSSGGTLVYRTEDLDSGRVVPGMADQQRRELEWLGLDWDEDDTLGGRHGPYLQSLRGQRYEAALRRLDAAGLLFPCALSRRDLAGIASAGSAAGDSAAGDSAAGDSAAGAYPARLRPDHNEPGWLEGILSGEDRDNSVRLCVQNEVMNFDDLVLGPQGDNPALASGDFVLRRRDSLFAYQLAVVVDDIEMGITEVVRGADLLASTAGQLQLWHALSDREPSWAHLPLLLNDAGVKLSKRDGGLELASLREAGVSPERLVGWLAGALGLRPSAEACRPAELLNDFSLRSLVRHNISVSNAAMNELRAVS
ncbi:MAG: tRNA glutamyl-Q(34) synthetase GluQRS [Proteobacteria bacterium]|nr:tRNA glutamyl-Q(34) synthetase GluQRS [Pseudomonadota bacterium]